MTQSLSRKQRRALQSEAARAYGVDGAAGQTLHAAYQALARQDIRQASQLAHTVSQSHPANLHPWLILGMIALDRHEVEAAHAFLDRACKIAPGDARALAGLGKALVLQADVFAAVELFERAIEAGSDDLSMARLYADLMRRMERSAQAAAALAPMAARLQSAALQHMVAELCLDTEDYAGAGKAFEAAYAADPGGAEYRIGHVKARLFRHDFAGVETESAEMLVQDPALEELIGLRMAALRNLGRRDEALALLDAPFATPLYYKRALSTAANIHIDRGEMRAADLAFRNALHLTDEERIWTAKAYGTFRFSLGDFAGGLPYYAERQPPALRGRIPYENSAPEALAARQRLFLVGEQGIGDQLALMALLPLAPVAAGAQVRFVGDGRMPAALAGNTLGLAALAQEDFDPAAAGVAPQELIYVGDLARYLPERTAPLGGFLRADADRVAELRARYAEMAQGRPVVGLAWRSGDSLTGHHRSVALTDLVATLPEGALAVNLQYGDCGAEIAEAARARPDVGVFADDTVDQMADLAGFFAQIMALERIVSIDNTTAHAAGALGHPDTHVLVPAGAECMWYWGREGTPDPWYGNLKLHRQDAPQDWAPVLAGLRALWQ
ncbi:tetratricopeptide repeat protein [Acidimangrovimonas pyrenivorans]|uniref:Tetratricopeptide repeat protein n=1 Tax=Acidimangrovimonas pyrenivorans TaxID=2030798 RepID=A0ABV7AMQ4_9RHOB